MAYRIKAALSMIALILFGILFVYFGLGFLDGYIHISGIIMGAFMLLMAASTIHWTLAYLLLVRKRKMAEKK